MPVRPSRQISHLCRPGECTNPTYGLHCHMGSSGWSLGLWWRPNSPCDPRPSNFLARVPYHPGDSHNKPHYEHDQEERERHPGNALGKCPGGLSFGSSLSYGHSGKWQNGCWVSDPSENGEVVTTKDTETIDAFLSPVIHVRMGMAHTGEGINKMT